MAHEKGGDADRGYSNIMRYIFRRVDEATAKDEDYVIFNCSRFSDRIEGELWAEGFTLVPTADKRLILVWEHLQDEKA